MDSYKSCCTYLVLYIFRIVHKYLVETTDLNLIQGYKVKNRATITIVSDTSIGVKSVKTLDNGEAEFRVGAER